MIKLPPKDLDAATLNTLSSFQAQYDALSTQKERNQLWKNKRQDHPIKPVVVDALGQMVHPRYRCMYCEDNELQQIEHFWPRAKYPELAFAWCNYLYSCGTCNVPKNAHFATMTDGGHIIEIRDETTPERWNRPAFIHPRYEDPMFFFLLDIRDTFMLNEKPGLDDADKKRASWTKEHLPINRDRLLKQRKLYYGTYVGDIEKYLQYKQRSQMNTAEHYRHRIRSHGHITVFREMQRQWRDLEDNVRTLFEQAPELQDANFVAPGSVHVAS